MHRTRDRSRRPARSLARRSGWRACAALAWALTLPGCSGTQAPQPDLVLITLGAFPVEALGCFGGSAELGGDLCSIGEPGTRFVWAFSTSGAPAPAMASLLTGLAPEAHGVADTAASFLRNDHHTLAEHLSRAGYATAAFVTDAGLNRSRHFDQGFDVFDDGGIATAFDAPPSPATLREAPARAAQWIAGAPSPFLAWVHLALTTEAGETPHDAVRRLDRSVSRLLAVLDARPTPPAILVTGMPAPATALAPAATRVALLWRPPRIGGGQGVTRVIRTPVSQLDIAPTLLRAGGLVDPATRLPGQTLPFRERRSGEPARTLEIRGGDRRALIGEGVYLVVGDGGAALGVAQLPLAGERAPELGPADDADELASRLWVAPEEP